MGVTKQLDTTYGINKYDNSDFCGECDHLNYTEKEQEVQKEITFRKPEHRCEKYDRKLYHNDNSGDYHPRILKCEQCIGGR